MRRFATLALIVVFSLAAVFLPRSAPAQTCGTWLEGPGTPDLPPGATVHQLVTSGADLYAITDQFPAPGPAIRRLHDSTWAQLPWDPEFGAPAAIVAYNGFAAVATSRIIGIAGNDNIWEIGVRGFNGSTWDTLAVGTRLYSRDTADTNLVSLRIGELEFFGGEWFVAGRTSASGIFSFSSAGVLFRFPRLRHRDFRHLRGPQLHVLP